MRAPVYALPFRNHHMIKSLQSALREEETRRVLVVDHRAESGDGASCFNSLNNYIQKSVRDV